MFRALRSYNFRLYFIGQGISLIGSWMQVVAISWKLYDMSESAFLLGIVGFLSQFPAFIIGPLSGVMIDRWNKHRVLILTQVLFMSLAFLASYLVSENLIKEWHIIVLSLCLGVINAFDMPVRHAFVVTMVSDRNHLGNAIALDSMLFNGARLIGPAIAGIIIAKFKEGICLKINAYSYLAVIFALLAMRHIPKKSKAPKSPVWAELKEGFGYAFGFYPIKSILLLITLISVMGLSFFVLLPIFARNILYGGPNTLGFLMSAIGVGAIIGTVILASRKNALGLEKIIPAAAIIFSIGLLLLSISKTLFVSLLLITVTGFGTMVCLVSCNTLLQTLVEDNKRGRIMSLYTMAVMGMTPVGSLISGSVASAIGAPNMVLIGGTFCLTGAIIFYIKIPKFQNAAHPVFIERGILPIVTEGIQSATELTSPPE